jgi:UMF1 family MFS transporter
MVTLQPANDTPAQPVREASKLGQYSWALFDWANQPFFTLVTTFIFGPYFANELVAASELARLKAEFPAASAADIARFTAQADAAGQAAWAFTQSASGAAIAILSPLLGSMADAAGRRKPYILIFQALVALGCIGLWWAIPGRPDLLLMISLAVIIATIGAEFSIVFNNSLLPNIVRPERIGWLSGFGWGMGYVGGLLALFVVLAVRNPGMVGLAPSGSPPLFGLDAETKEIERLIGPASALWLAIFVLPMFFFTPDTKPTGLRGWTAARTGVVRLWGTVRKLRHYRNPALFLLAYMIYNDGLAAIIFMGGVYAKAAFGWSLVQLGVFGIVVTIFAAAGAFVGGALDDRFGSKRTVQVAIAGVTVATIGILSVTATSILFGVSAAPLDPARSMFASVQELTFMGFGILLGICMGPMQAASRTMMGRLSPPEMSGEFYGLFALSGRATTFLCPLLIGLVTAATGGQREGLLVVLAFLVVGFVLLWGVREERAERVT